MDTFGTLACRHVGLTAEDVVTDWGLAVGMGRGRADLRRAVELLLDAGVGAERRAGIMQACVEAVKRARIEPPVAVVIGRGINPSRAAGAFRLSMLQRAALVELWFAAQAGGVDELREHCDQAIARLEQAIGEAA